MFTLRRNAEPSALDREITRVYTELNAGDTDSEHYATLLSYLERLNELKTQSRRKPASTDTWINAGAQFAGILVMVGWEQKHVITSKALSLIKFK